MNPKVATWCLAGIVFVCEMMGGMSSVALTDAIQASMLVFAFCLMPMLIQSRWGGLDGFVGQTQGTVDGEVRPYEACDNQKAKYTAWPQSPPSWGSTSEQPGVAPGGGDITFNGKYNQTLYGCIADTSPWMLLTPVDELVQLMFSICTVFISWPIQPMAMHRVMVAKDGKSVRASILGFLIFPVIIFLPMIVMGLAAAAEYPGSLGANAFMTICGSMFHKGKGYAFVAVMFMTSSIA